MDLTLVVQISDEDYAKIRNIINLGDLLEKAVQDRITRLIQD